jgi:uncharacterized protein (DUF1697 family)
LKAIEPTRGRVPPRFDPASPMTRYVALLRAVNVGGTGKIAMSELRAICAELGFDRVETYIQSGNVVFDSEAATARVKAALEARLKQHFGKPMGVLLRSAAEMAAVVKANPFPTSEPRLTYAIFLDEPPPADALDRVVGRTDEEMRLGAREIYVQYPNGMGRSKLRIPAAKAGTARNMNSVAKLAEMAKE